MTLAPAAAVFGQPLTLTAAVKSASKPARTGNVEFLEDGAVILTVALNAGSHAGITFTPVATGSHSYQAIYLGDADFKASTSSLLKRTVGKDKTSVQIGPVAGPIAINQPFNLNVQVTVQAPGARTLTGELVTVKENGKAIGTLTLNSTASATWTGFSFTVSGTQNLSVLFPGDADTLAATSPLLKLTVM